MKLLPPAVALSANRIVLLFTVYALLVHNIGLWRALWQADAPAVVVVTFPLFVGALLFFCLQWLFWPGLHRVLVPVLLLVGAGASYAIMVQGVLFDAGQIYNIVQTDATEAGAWISLKFVLWLLLTGVLPALWYVCCVRVRRPASWLKGLAWRFAAMLGTVATVVAIAAASYSSYASFLRNNRAINKMVVPVSVVGAALKAGYQTYEASKPFEAVGLDARRSQPQGARKNLLVLVVGETTRAQNWGLNPGAPATTPQLQAMQAKGEAIINFSNVSSCGTATAVSVPCLFSRHGREDFSLAAARHEEGLMDVLQRAGLATYWRENDSGCKGVCDRIRHVQMHEVIADAQARCQGNLCDDMVLLEGLQAQIDAMPGDGVIVLHTNGSHGPAYFERYGKAMRRFTPTCDTNQLQDCTREQLVNTYNNTIVAIDHMLARTIELLAQQTQLNTALLYVSDHGESLGERGMYLHGAPYAIAPPEQTQVPMIFWASPSFYRERGIDAACLRQSAQQPHSHDGVFHTVLGVMGVQTSLYQRGLDWLNACARG